MCLLHTNINEVNIYFYNNGQNSYLFFGSEISYDAIDYIMQLY